MNTLLFLVVEVTKCLWPMKSVPWDKLKINWQWQAVFEILSLHILEALTELIHGHNGELKKYSFVIINKLDLLIFKIFLFCFFKRSQLVGSILQKYVFSTWGPNNAKWPIVCWMKKRFEKSWKTKVINLDFWNSYHWP